MTSEKIEIYTDGACSGNPGAGGWGAVLLYKEHIKKISGGEKDTTNNRMELKAVIESLRAIKKLLPTSSSTPIANMCKTASWNGFMAGKKTAGRTLRKSQSRM